MAQVFIKPGIWFDEEPVHTELASVEVSSSRAMVDVTALNSGSVEREPGLYDTTLAVSGFVDDQESIAGALVNSVASADTGIWTFAPESEYAVASAAYLGTYRTADVNPVGGAIGEAQRLNISASGDGALVRGSVLYATEAASTSSVTSYDGPWTDIGTGTLTVHIHAFDFSSSADLTWTISYSTSSTGSGASILKTVRSTSANSWRATLTATSTTYIQLSWDLHAADRSATIIVAYGK